MLTALPNFFQKCHHIAANTQQLNDVTDKEDAVHNNEIRCDRSETPSGDNENTETLQMSKPIEPLTLTTSSLHTLTTLRNTVGKLKAEFTQFKIAHSGNIEQLRTQPSAKIILSKYKRQPWEALLTTWQTITSS